MDHTQQEAVLAEITDRLNPPIRIRRVSLSGTEPATPDEIRRMGDIASDAQMKAALDLADAIREGAQ